MLHLCIRALDYCPPVDITFGDYLRALITADADLVANDRLNYRLAVIEAFRRRGIYPLDVRSLSEESLLWNAPQPDEEEAFARALPGRANLRQVGRDWGLKADREGIFWQSKKNQARLHDWFTGQQGHAAVRAAGLTLDENAPAGIYRTRDGHPALEIHSVRSTYRIGPDGQTITDLVVEMTQRRRGYYDPGTQHKVDAGEIKPPKPDFIFRGGCTLLVNLETGKVRYCVSKNILSERRLEAQRRFLSRHPGSSLRATYFGDPRRAYFENLATDIPIEPLALIHRSYEDKFSGEHTYSDEHTYSHEYREVV
jgi:hypothetical protein